MFIRINTLRINCDAIASYEPVHNDRRVNQYVILITYVNDGYSEIKCNNGNQLIKILKKLDDLFEIKENLASRLPKRDSDEK